MELRNIYLQARDFLSWAADCHKIAASNKLGDNYEHIHSLQRDFHRFAIQTLATGSQWVWSVCDQCDGLVTLEHSESHIISMWRDEITEAWENLLELIDTRIQALEANYSWHVFMHNCRATLAAILEKMQRWVSITSASGDHYTVFEPSELEQRDRMQAEIAGVKSMVKNVRKEYKTLARCYSGENLVEISSQAEDVESCWRHLEKVFLARPSVHSIEKNELAVFLREYADLRLSIEDLQGKLQPWPQDFENNNSQMDSLMNDHWSMKEVIALREQQLEDFTHFGNSLIDQRHFASIDVENKLLTVNKNWLHLMQLWEQRYGAAHRTLLNSTRSVNGLKRASPSVTKTKETDPAYAAVIPRRFRQRKDPDDASNFFAGIASSSPDVLARYDSVNKTTPGNIRTAQSGTNKASALHEGVLFRKRLRKPYQRSSADGGSWRRLYCALHDNRLIFYSSTQNKEKGKISKKYPPVPVIGATVTPNVSFRGLAHVFSVRLPDGAEYLFQATDQERMHNWVKIISLIINKPKQNVNIAQVQQLDSATSGSAVDSLSPSSPTMNAQPQALKRFFGRKKQNGALTRG